MRFHLPLLLVAVTFASLMPGVGLARECPELQGESSRLVEIKNAHNGVLRLEWAGDDRVRLVATYSEGLVPGSLKASLDGKDISERFSPGDEGEPFDIIPLTLPEGEYTLRFTGYTEAGKQSSDFSDCNPMPMEWQRFTITRRGPGVNVGNTRQGAISAEEARKIRQQRSAQ